jgi:O-antigen ligase
VAPVYLLLCLLLGGSVQGIWSNAFLQLTGIAILAWAAASWSEPPVRALRQLLWIARVGLAIGAIQLLPLPASLWTRLGGRSAVAEGFAVLGLPIPAMPISVAPYSSVETLLTLIPPFAMFVAVACLRAYRASWLALALLAGTFTGILLGALQVVGGSETWYPYRQSSFGFATGFFANANHMATLLVISLAFLAALLASARGGTVQRYSAAVALVGGAALVVLVGLVLNGSLAGYGLVLPVIAASLLLVIPTAKATRRRLALGAAGLLVAAAAAMTFSPAGDRDLGATTSVTSRAEILGTTAKAIGDFLPLGSGLGTFRPVYQFYEDPDTITNTRVPHAHNDYAELALELGIPGIVLVLVFLLWWGAAAARAWRVADATPFARAASIASAAILAHSLVDYPLRTAAIAACFAMCLALLPDRKAQKRDESELWPARHLVLR